MASDLLGVIVLSNGSFLQGHLVLKIIKKKSMVSPLGFESRDMKQDISQPDGLSVLLSDKQGKVTNTSKLSLGRNK